jgi:glutathione S-transferase
MARTTGRIRCTIILIFQLYFRLSRFFVFEKKTPFSGRLLEMMSMGRSLPSDTGGSRFESEIELIYGNIGGAALIIRLAFAIGEVKFKDTRLRLSEDETNNMLTTYARFKHKMPVIRIDGKPFTGYKSIAPFAAKKAYLYPVDPTDLIEGLAIDSFLDTVTYLMTPFRTLAAPERFGFAAYTNGSTSQKNHMEFILKVHFPRLLTSLENTISAGENGFAVCGRLTIADVALFSALYTATHEVGQTV